MAKKPKTTEVRSINNVKHDGEWHLPGTTWECPTKDLKALLEAGAVERYAGTPVDDQEPVVLPQVGDMKKDEIIAELKSRSAIFDESEGVEALREVLTMARSSQAK